MGQIPMDRPRSPMAHTLARSFLCLAAILVTSQQVESRTVQLLPVGKRTITSDMGVSDYPDYQAGVKYDEYPLVVPKRTALLLDKVMVALQKAMDEEAKPVLPPNFELSDRMDLQRRGQQKGRVYWRCYFNAVTCFKRK